MNVNPVFKFILRIQIKKYEVKMNKGISINSKKET